MPAFLCMRPPLFSVLASATKRNLQEMAQGLAGSVAALASVIGWLAGRLMYSVLGPRVFVISATLTLLVFVLGFATPLGSAGLGVDALSTNRLERWIDARSDK